MKLSLDDAIRKLNPLVRTALTMKTKETSDAAWEEFERGLAATGWDEQELEDALMEKIAKADKR